MAQGKWRRWLGKPVTICIGGQDPPERKPGGLLSQEKDIVWLEDPTAHPFIYEDWARAPDRTDQPELAVPGRLIGYAVLRPHSHPRSPTPGHFMRRIWYLCDPSAHRSIFGKVDPRSVAPGQHSRHLGVTGLDAQP
jgi:hypothetical protein